DEVIPKCTYAAASRGRVLSAQADRNAMTSCWVTASIAATASGVGGGAPRTGPTTSAGTVPASACACSTSVSTRHHVSYLCASDQIRPISGRVYRSITAPILPAGRRRGGTYRPHLDRDACGAATAGVRRGYRTGGR